MTLIFDIGNTNIKTALFEGNTLKQVWRLSTDIKRTGDEYFSILRSLFRDSQIDFYDIKKIVLSTVVPALIGPFVIVSQHITGKKPILLSPENYDKLPIKIPETAKHEIGTDLLCDALAAWTKYKTPCIIADFGTALSFTALNQHGCTTDFIQGALIFIAFVVSSVFIVIALGGFGNSISQVEEFTNKAISGEFGKEMLDAFTANKSYSILSAISAFSWCLGYFGMPHIIIRFMGIRSNTEVKTARRVGITWMVISYIGTFLIGTLGTAYLYKHGILLGTNSLVEGIKTLGTGTQEAVFSESMKLMYPAFIAGIFLCAILAASMSTADSQLLSASSAIGQDIFKGLIKKDASDKTVLLVSRVSVFAIALIGLLLATNPNSSIFGLVSFAWSGFGGTFGPLILLALYWKRTTASGAIAGLICGGITDVVWHYLKGGIFNVYEILPAFIVCLIVTIVVSLCTKENEEVSKKFDEYKAMKD